MICYWQLLWLITVYTVPHALHLFFQHKPQLWKQFSSSSNHVGLFSHSRSCSITGTVQSMNSTVFKMENIHNCTNVLHIAQIFNFTVHSRNQDAWNDKKHNDLLTYMAKYARKSTLGLFEFDTWVKLYVKYIILLYNTNTCLLLYNTNTCLFKTLSQLVFHPLFAPFYLLLDKHTV